MDYTPKQPLTTYRNNKFSLVRMYACMYTCVYMYAHACATIDTRSWRVLVTVLPISCKQAIDSRRRSRPVFHCHTCMHNYAFNESIKISMVSTAVTIQHVSIYHTFITLVIVSITGKLEEMKWWLGLGLLLVHRHSYLCHITCNIIIIGKIETWEPFLSLFNEWYVQLLRLVSILLLMSRIMRPSPGNHLASPKDTGSCSIIPLFALQHIMVVL
jgi:hypothetical protein